MLRYRSFSLLLTALFLATALAPSSAMAAATFVINNLDDPLVGLNDPTPVSPVGGNPGTTLGQQRRIALQYALDIWGSYLESDVPIIVQVRFDSLACDATSILLGRTRALKAVADFDGAPVPNTWYPVALANSLAGVDLIPGPLDPAVDLEEPKDDIVMRFNINLDSDPDCYPPRWYYGLDGNPGEDYFSFVQVALHEAAHGLGFNNLVNEETGAYTTADGLPDIFTRMTWDNLQGLFWDEMTDHQRAVSAQSCGQVVWTGPQVTRAAGAFLNRGNPGLRILRPTSLRRVMQVGVAEFGPSLSTTRVSGKVVLTQDLGGESLTDACEPLTDESARQVKGKIALIDRGRCAFTQKVEHAEEAGARGVIVADTSTECPIGMLLGSADIGIPSVRISKQEGDLLKAALPDLVVSMGANKQVPIASDDLGRLHLFAQGIPQNGSTLVHWDLKATPNLLLEFSPGYEDEVNLDVDLTPFQLADVGWRLVTVKIDDCDSGLPDVPLPGGGRAGDLVDLCRDNTGNHGQFVSCIAEAATALRRAGLATPEQARTLLTCASQPTRH